MTNPQEFYRQLEDQIKQAEQKRDELLKIAANERVWQGYEYVHGRVVPDTATVFYDAAMRFDAEVAMLKTRLPCYKFAKQFGWFLHETYREKYPINSETILIRWTIQHAQSVYYHIMKPMNIFEMPTDGSIPALKTDTKEALFERWATKDFIVDIRLAYAPETNMVYWMNLHEQR